MAPAMTIAVVVVAMFCLATTQAKAAKPEDPSFPHPGAGATPSVCEQFTPEGNGNCPSGTGSMCKIDVGGPGGYTPTGDCGSCSVAGNVVTCSKLTFEFTSKTAVTITYGNTITVNNAAIKYSQSNCRTTGSKLSSPIQLATTGKDTSHVQVCFKLCDSPGGVCGDPKLVGGDGVMFYFHGRMNDDFCLVSDSDLHINAHFIGKRPEGRTRDFTWVQALGFVYGSHTLTIAAKRVAQWDNHIDQLEFAYNGEAFALAAGPSSSWASPEAAMTLSREGATNAVDLEIKEKMGVSLNVVPIGKRESDVHHYGITGEDCFAHLDMQFRFYNLSTAVNGVLGQTYQPGFVSPVTRGVAMPVMRGAMGGADRYASSSLLATDCKVSQYTATAVAHGSAMPSFTAACGSSDLPSGVPGGMTCRR